MNSPAGNFYLLPQHWALMEADVRLKAPEEACGIVAGEHNHARLVIPVTNVLHSPHRFRMDPEEELKALYQVEERGLEIIAVYHSHPHGIDRPSPTDHAELTFPGTIYLIWYEYNQQWHCRAYKMNSQDDSEEISLVINES